MPEAQASRLRLMALLSPTFPVGGFAHSRGLERAAHDDLGSATILSDISAMKHETQHSRLFRS